MGCWNKTCGLSNLHINAGDPVYVFVLEQNPVQTDRCYTTAFWKPLLLPFESKYDDYGGGEDSSGFPLPHIIEGIRGQLVEMKTGENQYHDIAVNRDDFSVEKFFEAVHKHRLFTTDLWSRHRMVDFVMMRKDIVDSIFENWQQEQYVGTGKGTGGWDNAYIKFRFADVLADVPAFVEHAREQITDLKDTTFLRHRHSLEFVVPWEQRHTNKVSWFVRVDRSRVSRIVDVDSVIFNALLAGDSGAAESLLTEYLKGAYIDDFMESSRRQWMPGGHEGSQNTGQNAHRMLATSILAVLDKERAEWLAEYENDEDEE
jgi:hypothetical protein